MREGYVHRMTALLVGLAFLLTGLFAGFFIGRQKGREESAGFGQAAKDG